MQSLDYWLIKIIQLSGNPKSLTVFLGDLKEHYQGLMPKKGMIQFY